MKLKGIDHDLEQSVKNGLDMEFGTWTDGLTMGATNAYDNSTGNAELGYEVADGSCTAHYYILSMMSPAFSCEAERILLPSFSVML